MPVRVIIGFLLFVLSIDTYASWPPLIHLNEDQQAFVVCIQNASTTTEKEHCLEHLPDQERAYMKQKLIEVEITDEPPSILKRRIEDIKNTALKKN